MDTINRKNEGSENANYYSHSMTEYNDLLFVLYRSLCSSISRSSCPIIDILQSTCCSLFFQFYVLIIKITISHSKGNSIITILRLGVVVESTFYLSPNIVASKIC